MGGSLNARHDFTLNSLNKMQHLKSLHLENICISDQTLNFIPKLQKLSLDCCIITHESLQVINFVAPYLIYLRCCDVILRGSMNNFPTFGGYIENIPYSFTKIKNLQAFIYKYKLWTAEPFLFSRLMEACRWSSKTLRKFKVNLPDNELELNATTLEQFTNLEVLRCVTNFGIPKVTSLINSKIIHCRISIY
jgi:hypothetical protein